MSNYKWIMAEILSQSSESSSIIRLMFIDSVQTHYDILASKICCWCRWERWLMTARVCGNIHPCLRPLINPPLSVFRSKVISSCFFCQEDTKLSYAVVGGWLSGPPPFPPGRCLRTIKTRPWWLAHNNKAVQGKCWGSNDLFTFEIFFFISKLRMSHGFLGFSGFLGAQVVRCTFSVYFNNTRT